MLWGWFLFTWFDQVSGKRRFITELLLTRSCQLLIPAALLLLCSALLDRGLIGLEQPQLFEELAETNAYLIMLLPALLGLRPTYTMQPTANLAASPVVRDEQGNRYPP